MLSDTLRQFARASRLRSLAASVAALMLGFTFAAPAVAAPRVEHLQVYLVGDVETRIPTIGVRETLMPEVPLPTRVDLRLPRQSVISWSGELTGETKEEGILLQPEVSRGSEYDLVSMTLNGSRTAYVEAAMYDRLPPAGSPVSPTVAYKVPEDVADAIVAIQVPAGSQVTSVTANAMTKPGPEGSTLYYAEYSDVKADETLSLSVSYTTASDQPTHSSVSPWAIVVIILGVVALMAAPFVRRAYGKKRPTAQQ